jgi:response regulator RpfG family c-di-GMP phosphodiesterase
VLFVDDEAQVLEGIKLHLRRQFEVVTATGAEEGLHLVATQPPFAIVVSDLRMPKVNGATFLAAVRRTAPDTVRMMLTGQSDIEAAAAAINRGQIYRFLSKPCPPGTLVEALDAGVNQYQIQVQRKEILEKTLGSSVKLLTDLLGLASPSGFGRANRIKQLANKMAERIGFKAEWYLDVAAMFSQVGLMIAPELAEKLTKGAALSTDDMVNLQQLPITAALLLSDIPHMQSVCKVLT